MGSHAETQLPALVLGTGMTALGVLRSLGRRGIPVWVGPWEDALLRGSRWHRPVPGRDRWASDAPVAENLETIGIDEAVLIPCSDAMALEVASLPHDIARRFPSYQASPDALRCLVDKGKFLSALTSARIPHPRTHLVDDPESLGDVPDPDPSRPLFIKPRDSQSFFQQEGRKAIRAADRSELETQARRLMAQGHGLILQEYVPGPPSNHYFVDGFSVDGGTIVACLVRQRLRMYPPDFGNSTYMVTVPEKEAAPAVDSLGRLVGSLDYRGIFSAEFKRDAQDGVFRILEVNARPWWYVEFAARAGLDVVPMAYAAALGAEPAVPEPYEVGRKLIYPYYDLHACMTMTSSRRKALLEFLRSLWGADIAGFVWDDPWPAVARWKRVAGQIAASRLRPGRARSR